MRVAHSADPGLIAGMSGLFLADALIEVGDARRARDVLLEDSDTGELHTSRSGHAHAYEVLTRAEVALGRLDAAEFWARRAETATHGGDLPAESAFAARASATVALARGDAPRAARVALAAAARADEARAPVEAGRCEIVAGRALARSEDRAGAVDALERAGSRLDRVGATGYRDQAERELRRLGRRRLWRTEAPKSLETFTSREREIAEHVRRGRTNREIAAALHLSEKTIEAHLSRAYAKLGVANRTELALRVSEGHAPEAEGQG